MTKMGICSFSDGYLSTDLVAPKKDYPTKEEFLKACEIEFEGYGWDNQLTEENVKEAHCRYYRIPPEGTDIDGGCYSFGSAGKGAFPVWRIPLDDKPLAKGV